MSIAFSKDAREVLEQVVRQPQFKDIITIPTLAPITIGLIVGAYTVFALSTYFWVQGAMPTLGMVIVNALCVYVAFSPLHDATHRTVSGNQTLNDLLGTIACFVLLPGITTRVYRYLHLEHHRYAGDPKKDPDEPFVSAASWKLPLVLASPDVVWTVWYLRHWSERPVSERIEFSLGLAFYLAWHIVWLLSPYASAFILCWLIPQRIGIVIVTYFFAHIQHPEGIQWETAPFQTTVHIPTNRVLRYLMLNQTEHCLHHLMPSVPLYRYHRAWEAGRHLFERKNIPVRGFFTPVESLLLQSPATNRFRRARVAKIDEVAQDIRLIELRPMEGESFSGFDAGAHIDVSTDGNLVRQYSLLNSPSEVDVYRIAVKRESDGRGGSVRLHESVREGDALLISDPRNNFPLDKEQQSYILIGGGIGLTPLLSMAYALHEVGAAFQLHLCAKSTAVLAFGSTLNAFPFASRISVHLDDGPESQKFSPTQTLGIWYPGRDLYFCGPSGFMTWISNQAQSLGWPAARMHSESFTPRSIDLAVNEPFQVELARSGRVLTVGAGEFLIDVLHRNKCDIPCSCTQGICGSCITVVLDGTPEHRDAILSDEDRRSRKKMCVCVSRAVPGTGRLVLDV